MMKTVNISDDQHNELRFLADKHELSINKLLQIVVKHGIKNVPDHITTLPEMEVDKQRFIDAINRFEKPVLPHLIFRYVNKQKGKPLLKPRECATGLFVMLLDGDVVCDEHLLYSLPGDADPI